MASRRQRKRHRVWLEKAGIGGDRSPISVGGRGQGADPWDHFSLSDLRLLLGAILHDTIPGPRKAAIKAAIFAKLDDPDYQSPRFRHRMNRIAIAMVAHDLDALGFIPPEESGI
jgi:hypothetical protein